VEAHVQSAYKQNRVTFDLIYKSMENVRGAFIEAKRARDQFNDILSVSSRLRRMPDDTWVLTPLQYIEPKERQ